MYELYEIKTGRPYYLRTRNSIKNEGVSSGGVGAILGKLVFVVDILPGQRVRVMYEDIELNIPAYLIDINTDLYTDLYAGADWFSRLA